VLALDFPPISHLIEWPDIWLKGNEYFAINKVVLLMFAAVLVVFAFFMTAARKGSLVPTGVQNMAEVAVDFVRNDIILQGIGPEGLGFTPFLLTLFSFIFVGNLFEVIPGIQMPVNARMAFPAFMAIVIWVIYHFVGIKHQGPLKYLKASTIPPGVPMAMLPLVAFIEFLQFLILRPFSLAVRLFANMLAGHLLLVTFAVLTAALFKATYIGAAAPLALLIALTGFEVLVAFLQAFIFTILAAVYIGGAMHPEH
jgi:F-type H+-transporting ATPase subunit a